MAPDDVSYHLMVRIRTEGSAPRVEDLMRTEYTIGRGDRKAGLKVDFEIAEDAYLSRAHCKLVRTEETYVAENLSPNGTKLNGRAIEGPQKLKHRDRLELSEATTVEFLALTDEERARELAAETGASPTKKKKGRPLTQRPMFWAMVGFYAVLVLALVSARGDEGPPIVDPGTGPYFQWMLRAPLRWVEEPEIRRQRTEDMWDKAWRDRIPAEERERVTKMVWDDARMRAQIPEKERPIRARQMWADAQVAYGGEGGNPYRLLREAMHVLGFLDFDNLKAAADFGDPIGKTAAAALASLEERMSRLYVEADRFIRSGHRAVAVERYTSMLHLVPDRYSHVHRFAATRLTRLQKR